jgi:hypothetical protein
MSDDWKQPWQEVVDAVGRDFSDGEVHWGADVVEQSLIRRYNEPIELDSPLHYDAEVARAHGYDGVIAPYTSALTWTIPAMWSPGEPALFDTAARNAQPVRSPINNQNFPLGPPTTGFFATDMELDFLRPVTVGERLGRRGNKLLSCTPKQTAVGRGAFMTWESEIVTADGEVVIRMRTGTYAYQPTSLDGVPA